MRCVKHLTRMYIAQKMKFSIKDFFPKCDQMRNQKSLIENFIFCEVVVIARCLVAKYEQLGKYFPYCMNIWHVTDFDALPTVSKVLNNRFGFQLLNHLILLSALSSRNLSFKCNRTVTLSNLLLNACQNQQKEWYKCYFLHSHSSSSSCSQTLLESYVHAGTDWKLLEVLRNVQPPTLLEMFEFTFSHKIFVSLEHV